MPLGISDRNSRTHQLRFIRAVSWSAQNFTLCQQATIEITCHDHSVIACSCHVYMDVVIRAHLVRGESHIQCNASGEVATALISKTFS